MLVKGELKQINKLKLTQRMLSLKKEAIVSCYYNLVIFINFHQYNNRLVRNAWTAMGG